MNTALAALRFICSCLGDGDSQALRRSMQSGQVPWEQVIGLANDHLLTPALWVALGNRNLRDDMPGNIQSYLAELHKMSVDRNAHLKKQLLEAVEKINGINITPVLLKGAKHLIADDYGDPGARIMTDLDLLVRKEEVGQCMDALIELGYQPDEDIHDDYHEDHHHCPPLFRPGDFAAVEIHRRIMDTPFDEVLDNDAALGKAGSLGYQDLSMEILSPTDRVLHNMLHSHLVDKCYVNGMLTLRSMHEVKTECAANTGRIDWESILVRMQENGKGRALNAFLYMANRLLGMPYPAGSSPTLAAHRHYLRCCGQLRWEWMDVWGGRMGKYSTDNIRKLSGCSSGWVSVNHGRLKMLMRRFNTDPE